ncbi:hypothetical protein [Alicyclobacillus sp. SO9]|uniref:hypothetical protein n=1 Tax=Alicyclobacillus sp. SO9 TaxID=2665646 RepID=UPI0018E825AE|nr:hypothetical protein [Alicyclobacillus sp. SO9]QQE79662.1 hypothetical protein GI364_04010 [Alicyclobacillus sp. SO9]
MKPSNTATIKRSGNASVIMYVDTSAIGYSYLAGLHARGILNDFQFYQAIQNYRNLLDKDELRKKIQATIGTRNIMSA